MTDVKSVNLNDILKLLKRPSEKDVALISSAFDFAVEAHDGQKRLSGEPYIIHPFEVARTLAQLQLDAHTITAGLLHDTCEDNPEITDKIIKKNFGEEVAFLVSAVTKIGKIKYRGTERQVENLRKIFLAMAKDIRVVLIRLADRLHNIRTLEHVPEEKRKRIAMETLEIYSPLANRLGMGKIKGELEDLSFMYLMPEEYANMQHILKDKYEQSEKLLAKTKYEIEELLRENKIKNFRVDSRVKHLFSLYKKMQKPDIEMNIDKIYDLIALRIMVESVEDCYRVLGIIHKHWTPLPGRIKDFIAIPKANGYQSLHTSVFAGKGSMIEMQIRTYQMHEEAEAGIAAHWAYSESGKPKKGAGVNPRLTWVNQMIEWQKNIKKPEDFLESLRIDFFKDRVFCFTPKGDVVDLPEGATAIDFAYSVHSDIGNSAVGAVINHKFVSLDSTLKNGDIIEIQTKKNKTPSAEWLRHAKTSVAKKHIKLRSKKN